MVHSYVTSCAKIIIIISSHIQILGCTYAISMSACGIQPPTVAPPPKFGVHASCVSNAQTGGYMLLRPLQWRLEILHSIDIVEQLKRLQNHPLLARMASVQDLMTIIIILLCIL